MSPLQSKRVKKRVDTMSNFIKYWSQILPIVLFQDRILFRIEPIKIRKWGGVLPMS